MKRVVIRGRWNDPIEFDWQGDLITTLHEMNKWTLDKDMPGYFFEIEDADKEYIKETNLPIFVNEYGTLLAPCDLMIVEDICDHDCLIMKFGKRKGE